MNKTGDLSNALRVTHSSPVFLPHFKGPFARYPHKNIDAAILKCPTHDNGVFAGQQLRQSKSWMAVLADFSPFQPAEIGRFC